MSRPLARRATMPSLLGNLVLTARDETLTGVFFSGHRVQPERARVGDGVGLDDEVLGLAAGQLQEYLRGERTQFDLPLDLSSGTALDARVWPLLQAIGFGETATYGELARDLGDPHLAQAVGGAVGRNPLSIVVPCHRVVGGDGSYTGFAGGERRKAWLLGHEAHVAGHSLVPPGPVAG